MAWRGLPGHVDGRRRVDVGQGGAGSGVVGRLQCGSMRRTEAWREVEGESALEDERGGGQGAGGGAVAGSEGDSPRGFCRAGTIDRGRGQAGLSDGGYEIGDRGGGRR